MKYQQTHLTIIWPTEASVNRRTKYQYDQWKWWNGGKTTLNNTETLSADASWQIKNQQQIKKQDRLESGNNGQTRAKTSRTTHGKSVLTNYRQQPNQQWNMKKAKTSWSPSLTTATVTLMMRTATTRTILRGARQSVTEKISGMERYPTINFPPCYHDAISPTSLRAKSL